MARQVIWSWPISIAGIIIYIFVFYQSQLYGDSGLQLFYLFLSLYGWYLWMYGGNNETELRPSKTSAGQYFYTILFGVGGTILLGYLLSKTDSDIPYGDAFTTAFGLIATWMLARKLLENWLYWIVIDITATGIYIFKGLYITSFQYFIFTILAVYGYLQWKRAMASE